MRKSDKVLFAIVFCGLFAGHVLAQSEKISIKYIPIPNQTIRFTLTSEGEIDLNYEGNGSDSLPLMSPMKMTIKNVFGMSQKTGSFDAQGRLEAELAYEAGESQFLMNGNPISLDEPGKKLIGKKFIAIYNNKGELLDLKIPDDLGFSPESIKQIMQSIYANIPKEPISVGETAILPANIDFQFPGFGAGPMKMEGETKTKLIALEKEADGRIASFDTINDLKLATTTEMDLPTGKLTINLDGKIKGTGNSRVNIDKGGVPMQSETIMNIDAKMTTPTQTGNIQMPNMIIKGAMKVTILAIRK